MAPSMVPSLASGVIAGLLVAFRDVSFALVYTNSRVLSGSMGLMMTSLLVSSILSQAVYTSCHALPGCIACPSSTAVPFQSVLAASIVKAVQPEEAVMTVLATFMLVAVLFGAVLMLLSKLPHLDTLKSAFPQPVVLGFLAVAGVGMVNSALELVHGGPGWSQAIGVMSWESTAQMAAALIAGAGNRLLSRMAKHFAVLPSCLLLQLTLFHGTVAAYSSLEIATAHGWLWEEFPAVDLEPLGLGAIRWKVIAEQAVPITSLMAMLVLDLSTTLLPIELMTPEKRTKMSREFCISGCSTAVAGFCFGSVSYVSLSPTRLNVDAGGHHRASGVMSMLVCCVWIVAGSSLTAFFPKFVVSGLLLHLAFGYLLDGLWESRHMMSQGETAVVLFIMLYYMATDLAPAIMVGLVICCFNFTLQYSSSKSLEFVTAASDAGVVSKRLRPKEDQRFLRGAVAGAIVVARTSCSHLFFGSIASIFAEIGSFLESGKCRFLIFDVASVRTIDSSTLTGLTKLPAGVELVMVGLALDLKAQVRRSAIPASVFNDLDEGLEWCEDKLLKFQYLQLNDLRKPLATDVSNNPTLPELDDIPTSREDVAAALRLAFKDDALDALCDLFLPVCLRSHQVVFHEGAAAPGLYIVASGSLQVFHGHRRWHFLGPQERALDGVVKRALGREGSASPRRGRPVKAGDVLCEAALFLPHEHTYSLVATEPSTLLLLTRDRMLQAEHQLPAAAIRLHRALMIVQSAGKGSMPNVAEKSGRVLRSATWNA